MKITNYKVAGAHAFPLDMLRYDRAWPRTEADSANLSRAVGNFLDPPHEGITEVELQCLGPITPGRWSSFLWTVIEIDGVPLV
jgi:hypothetical protein